MHPRDSALLGQRQRTQLGRQDQEHGECGSDADHAHAGQQAPPAGAARGQQWPGEPVEGGVRECQLHHPHRTAGTASAGRGHCVAV